MKSIPLQAIADEPLAYAGHAGHHRGMRQTVVALTNEERFRQDADLAEAVCVSGSKVPA